MKIKFLENYINDRSKKFKNTITKKNLYIFPNKRGFQIGVLIFFCFATSIFYQNNFALLLSIILFFIFFISILISYQNLINIEFKIIDNLFPSNEILFLEFLIFNKTNRERLNIDLQQDNSFNNIDIKDNTKIKFKNIFQKRGIHNIPPIHVKSVFPFGVIKTFCKIYFDEKLIIYPKPIKPPKHLLDIINNQNEEGFDYEFDKIEENEHEKNLSKVSWKHYSIKKKYYHKRFKFNKETNNLVIDIELLGSNLERSLSYAAYLINDLFKSKTLFSIKYKNYISKMSCSYEHKRTQLIYLANV